MGLSYFNPKITSTMRQLLLLIAAQFILFTVSAQITYQKGYFIDNEGAKIEGLIKNIDWRNNPNSINYKGHENDDNQTVSIEEIQEFGIYGFSKYVKADVQLDLSSSNLNNLNYDKNPDFVADTLFLKVLVEGTATLYGYTAKHLTRYFFKLQNSEIEPLIFKKYRLEGDKVRSNNQFKQQLHNSLSCQGLSSINISGVEYKKKDLEKYFVDYNNCVGSCLLYTSPSPRDQRGSRMPSSA